MSNNQSTNGKQKDDLDHPEDDEEMPDVQGMFEDMRRFKESYGIYESAASVDQPHPRRNTGAATTAASRSATATSLPRSTQAAPTAKTSLPQSGLSAKQGDGSRTQQ